MLLFGRIVRAALGEFCFSVALMPPILRLLVVAALFWLARPADAAECPNIILILAGDLGCSGVLTVHEINEWTLDAVEPKLR